MGWAGGSDVGAAVVQAVQENVRTKKARKAIYASLIDMLQHHDCETTREILNEHPDTADGRARDVGFTYFEVNDCVECDDCQCEVDRDSAVEGADGTYCSQYCLEDSEGCSECGRPHGGHGDYCSEECYTDALVG